MANLRATLILGGFLSLTFLLMPIQFLLLFCSSKLAQILPWYYHRILVRLLGVTIDIEGDVPNAPALIVSNHASWLDIPILSSVMPLSFIAKREVAGWPLFGWLAKLQQSVFINRENRISTGQSARVIKARFQIGDSFVLFPEGTSGDGKSVRTFKSSFFGVVDGLDVPVIPITLAYYSNYGLPLTEKQRPNFAWYGDMDLAPHLWAALKMGPIVVKITIHAPLPQKSRKQMASIAESVVRKGLAEALHGRPEIR